MNILSRSDLLLYKQTLLPESSQYREIERMLILGWGCQQLSNGAKVYLTPECEHLLGAGPLSEQILSLLQELKKAISSLMETSSQKLIDSERENRFLAATEALVSRQAELDRCDEEIKRDIEGKIQRFAEQIHYIGDAQVDTQKRLENAARQQSEQQSKVNEIQKRISDISNDIWNTQQQIEQVEDDQRNAKREFEKNIGVDVVIGGLFGHVIAAVKGVFDAKKYIDQINNLKQSLNEHNDSKQTQEAELSKANTEMQALSVLMPALDAQITSLQSQQAGLTVQMSDLGAAKTVMERCKADVFIAIQDVGDIRIDDLIPEKYKHVETKAKHANEAIARYEDALKAHSHELI